MAQSAQALGRWAGRFVATYGDLGRFVSADTSSDTCGTFVNDLETCGSRSTKQMCHGTALRSSRNRARFARTQGFMVPPSSRFALLWHDFKAASATSTEAPGVRAAWHKGRQTYAVWVLRVHDETVKQRVYQLSEALREWVTPEPDLHVTLAIAGFPQQPCVHDDDVPIARLKNQAEAVQAEAQRVSFRVHGACSFLAAPFLCVTDDDGHLARLRRVLDPPGRPLTIQDYVPHITAGRWKEAYATAVMAKRMEPLMKADPLTVTAQAVELVEYAAADPQARLMTKLHIPLP